MKKGILIVIVCCLLSGCAAPTFETLGDVLHEPVMAPSEQLIHLSIPKNAAAETLSSEQTAYVCDNYSFWVQTMASGDLKTTVKALSGFTPDKLTVMESRSGSYKRYDWTWTAAGESGDLVFRAAVIDDGNYHYCVSSMADAEDMAQIQEDWNALFSSFAVS